MKYEARVGLVESAVVEGPSKKDPAVLTGRTEHNKLVHFASEPLKVGTYADVRVTKAARQYLMGDLVEVTRRSKHRTRISVTAG